jgi:aminoglycoside phosphotransferase (APT) family kinase protein
MANVQIPTTTLIEDLLREQGRKVECPVEFDFLHAEERNRSWLYYLTLRCTGRAEIPAHLLLKTLPEESREVAFYQKVIPLDLPIPRCFATRRGTPSYILMEDLTSSHSDACDWPMSLPEQASQDVVEAIARLHAVLWDQPEFGPLPAFLSSRKAHDELISFLRRDFEITMTGLGDTIPDKQKRLIASVLNYLPRLWEEFWQPRLASGKGLPVIHGDLNPCNILYPHQPGERVVLVDWEAYRRGLPTSDLAMLFGLHLCPQQDDVQPLLSHYHACLVKQGVRGYSIGDLLQDYQVALLYELFFPLKLYSQAGIQDQTMLENAVLAVESFSDQTS